MSASSASPCRMQSKPCRKRTARSRPDIRPPKMMCSASRRMWTAWRSRSLTRWKRRKPRIDGMPGKKVKAATNLLKVPSPEADDKLVNLADWVEMKALLESDGNASLEDLARALQRGYSLKEADSRVLAGDVFKELKDRETHCAPFAQKGPAWQYPFTVNKTGNLLSL